MKKFFSKCLITAIGLIGFACGIFLFTNVIFIAFVMNEKGIDHVLFVQTATMANLPYLGTMFVLLVCIISSWRWLERKLLGYR